jgi:hypothetical protein
MIPNGLEDIDPTSLHGRPGPIRVQTSAIDIALFTPCTRTAPHPPCLIIAVEEEGDFHIDHQLVEFMDNIISFLPMAVDQQGVGVRGKDLAHLLRGRGVWRAAEASAISITSKLALEPYPKGSYNARGLDGLHMISAALHRHCVIRS